MKKGVCVHQGADGSACLHQDHRGFCKSPGECQDFEDALDDLGEMEQKPEA